MVEQVYKADHDKFMIALELDRPKPDAHLPPPLLAVILVDVSA